MTQKTTSTFDEENAVEGTTGITTTTGGGGTSATADAIDGGDVNNRMTTAKMERDDVVDVDVAVLKVETGGRGNEDNVDYSRIEQEAAAAEDSPCCCTWDQCSMGYKSWLSRNAAWSVLTCNGLLCAICLNGIACILVINGFASILSLNSVFSIASMNCAFCIGCQGTAFCIGEGL